MIFLFKIFQENIMFYDSVLFYRKKIYEAQFLCIYIYV